ncbi:hypothetical protein SAMN05216327_101650 [Dyadobacter sp. SG02]|uniref:hypothetical protein n=1 Tax=Dyadobacter sp. SG02 TaxID=1855291 RepID=UPI0008ACC187|nr:hypothetical protein [Dyadobacter sp. SG02]SEI44933.1 hypothetical protein SAMN05216327_101650 [Dyadobacter sp. SG02]
MELVRKIIVPTSTTFTLTLPEEMIGKEIEVVASEVKAPRVLTELEKDQRMQAIRAIFKDYRVDLSNFKFNRDEANNYDD